MNDLIERQAAIDALRTCYDTETVTMDNGDEYINYGDAVGEIEQLPPIQSKLLQPWEVLVAQAVLPQPEPFGTIKHAGLEHPLSDEEIIPRLRDIQAQVGGSYAIDRAIEALTVLPQPKMGKWIYHIDDLFPAESTQECDQCHSEQPLTCDDNYCPNCGAKMMPSNAK